MTLLAIFAGCALLGGSSALQVSPVSASASSAIEQYCFPKSDASFLGSSMWPSVTMMYSGITLTTASVTLTVSGGQPTETIGSIDQSVGQQPHPEHSSSFGILSSGLTQVPHSDNNGQVTESSRYTGSPGMVTSENSPSATASAQLGTSRGGTLQSELPGASGSFDFGASSTLGNSGAMVATNTPLLDGSSFLESTTVPAVSPSQGAPALTSGFDPTTGQRSSQFTFNPVSSHTSRLRSENPSPTPNGALTTTTISLPATTDGSFNQSDTGFNHTVDLSSAAIDALSLAQFFKNLGVSMFNSSELITSLVMNNDTSAVRFAAAIANISLVSLQSG